MMRSKSLLTLIFATLFMLVAGQALAATSVSWLSPPDGSTYPTGTVVNPTGQASASGTTGGTGLDLALVIDVSGSMYGSGITYAKQAATALVNALPPDTTSVTVIAFSSYANTVQTLTALNPDKASVINAINSLSAYGGTYIGSGIDAAVAELTSSRHTAGRSQQMVVLSDGYSSGTPATNAAAANAAGITVHSVGIPGHNVYQMSSIATAGGGIYTNVSDLTTLQGLFDGTGGNLVGIDHVDIQLPDGTWIYDIAIDGLGNFVLPNWVIESGVNTFTAYAYGDDGTSASAVLNLNGQAEVPEPSTMLLLGSGLAGLIASRRKKKA